MSSALILAGGGSPAPREMERVAAILHREAGIVLAPGKTSMVQSRLAKRLRALGLHSYSQYLDLVSSDAGLEERRRMISALTTNVSHFFREAHHFDLLRQQVLPELAGRLRDGGRVRFWSAGCSNGQEPWSLAMTVSESISEISRLDFRILATDIDPEVLKTARAGIYPLSGISGLPETLRKRYLTTEGENCRISAKLHTLVSFHELNLHADWPMRGKFDVIFCRNVVIYFDAATQNRLWQRFSEVLIPGGWLFVGHSERATTGESTGLTPAGITCYRRLPSGTLQVIRPGTSRM